MSNYGPKPRYNDEEHIRARERQKKWNDANRERAREINRRSQLKHRERRLAEKRAWGKRPDVLAKGRARYHALDPKAKYHRNRSHVLSKYGLSLKNYEAMLRRQKGVCAICKGPPTSKLSNLSGTMSFAVDHDHKTGAVRGLLCSPCNAAIGHYEYVVEDERFLRYLGVM